VNYGAGEPQSPEYDDRPSKRSARIEEHLNTLDDALSLLAEQVERAGLTLVPVLRPEQDSAESGDRAVAMIRTQSQLAERLEACGARARTLGRVLRETLDRVDL
jgi:predicted component of type VI protein secretion system